MVVNKGEKVLIDRVIGPFRPPLHVPQEGRCTANPYIEKECGRKSIYIDSALRLDASFIVWGKVRENRRKIAALCNSCSTGRTLP